MSAFSACIQDHVFSCSYMSTQCNTLYDGDDNTCHVVPHNRYPWSLRPKFSVGCIPLKYDGLFHIDVIGKGLICDDVMFGYQDNEVNQNVNKTYILCYLTGPETVESTFVACHFACHPSKMPFILFLDVKGENMEVCEVKYI